MRHYLFSTYYKASNPDRELEYDFCVNKNKSAGFDRIYLLVESESDMRIAQDKFDVEVINLGRRPTFEDFFDILRSEEFSDSVNIVANTDIFFLNMQEVDANIHRLRRGETCFALTRYDYHHNRPSDLFDRIDSQDTWIFNGNAGLSNVARLDFTMGVAGCDNKLAHELFSAGFEVLNPSRTIKSFHLHDTGIRSNADANGNQIVVIPPPYLLIQPTE